MFYILGLFVILGLILSGFTGSLPFDFSTAGIFGAMGNALGNFKDKTHEFIFPKSDNEILVNNLNSNYNLLDRFFSESSDSILSSKDISDNEKTTFKEAAKAFSESKDQIKVLDAEIKRSEPRLAETVVKKILDIMLPDQNKNNSPEPTYIPPNCNLVCSE